MKRIFNFLVLISLATIIFFQVKSYRKFSTPNNYDYPINVKDIDVNYHNQKIVLEYFETATKLGNFAREQWLNHNIDVLFAEKDNPASINANITYQKMLSHTKLLEARLIQSQKLKSQGFDNEAIAYIESKGISEKQYAIHKLLAGRSFKKGDQNRVIWEIQKLINQKGNTIKIDGIFSEETELAIKKIQEQKQVYPSGILDEDFLKILL
jgi:hypothetical protein